ncbi:MAG TPA: YicC family protein [Bacteroidales bacterium]|nr:YicC family protein [Bacteroidales bacterium]HOK98241.1 YicC family protein [Bacteroidales bacterium]HPO65797.1 YicC family protein [Bacteroidales bacterium]
MIKSMTGFGKATQSFGNKTLSVEIRSVNSKQFDLYLKLPNPYKEKELDIRQLLAQQIERGKVECTLTIEENIEAAGLKLNTAVIKDYFNQIQSIAADLNIELTDRILGTILRLPDAMKAENESITEEEWKTVESTLSAALNAFDEFRRQEGQNLANDLLTRVNLILEYLANVEPYEKERIERIRTRLKTNMSEALPNNNIDPNRFEQELIYYLEKLDITEEKVRLQNHCNYFVQTLNEPVSNGRKLSFIAQEMGREINTIGSKANDAQIQKLVVMMKDELEKIKEQLGNIL